MGYMVCCALKEHRASPRSPQLLAVRTVPACCCCHSCFPISPWHLSGNVGVWDQDWGSEQKFLLVYLLKTLLLVFFSHFLLLVPTFLLCKINVSSSAKSLGNADTSNTQHSHWVGGTWQSPSRTCPCFISKHVHCQEKALSAISQISKTSDGRINAGTDLAEKWANRTGMMTQDTTPRS